ncbi:hypothetical protein QZH41_005452 [Actinostola sp. cb2023]|nr:hypothetical protein QZH41_005452 [Actinostola sp. cb2023]
MKQLENKQNEGGVTSALAALRRNLARPVNFFDQFEAIEQLEALVRVARTTVSDKADEYAAILDEVKDRHASLPPRALRRLMSGLLGDPYIDDRHVGQLQANGDQSPSPQCAEAAAYIMCYLLTEADDIIKFLISRDSSGKTVVHKPSCSNSGCACPRRLAAGTVDSYLGKIRAIFNSMGRTMSPLALCHRWPSVTTGPVSQLAQWHYLPSGPMSLVSPLAQCHRWSSVTTGPVSPLAQCHHWPSVTTGPVSPGPVSPLAQCHYLPSVTTGPVSLLAQWPSVTSVTTGPVALLAQWHYWPSGPVSLVSLLAQCHYWPSGTTGPVALLAQWPSVTSVTTGPVSLLAQWHYWPSGTTGPVAQCH